MDLLIKDRLMPKVPKTIEDLGEFGFIRSIANNCINNPEGVIQGIGDDCAVIGPFGEKVLLVTTDLLAESIHFLLDRIPPEHIGEKAIAVNLSDIAAMGGVPRHAFVSIALPLSFPVDVANALYKGIKGVCKRYGVNILGGDTSASPAGLFINIVVTGEAHKDKVVYRKGASIGEIVYVCGTLGESVAGLKILKGEIPARETQWPSLILAHTRPRPLVEEGSIIGTSGLASAMIDVSDGLVADLEHICEQSGVGAEIREELIPLSGELARLGERYHVDVMEYALMGGEDYCLLAAVPPDNAVQFEGLLEEKTGKRPTAIGKITRGSGVRFIGRDGKQRSLAKGGYDHFLK
ncbi:MAG TPA: thiamine-phosphate kinase [Desulfobacterales bacterium]|nr:thiamine-phosphate kinase [Desulfobacterales bacterium]